MAVGCHTKQACLWKTLTHRPVNRPLALQWTSQSQPSLYSGKTTSVSIITSARNSPRSICWGKFQLQKKMFKVFHISNHLFLSLCFESLALTHPQALHLQTGESSWIAFGQWLQQFNREGQHRILRIQGNPKWSTSLLLIKIMSSSSKVEAR